MLLEEVFAYEWNALYKKKCSTLDYPHYQYNDVLELCIQSFEIL